MTPKMDLWSPQAHVHTPAHTTEPTQMLTHTIFYFTLLKFKTETFKMGECKSNQLIRI